MSGISVACAPAVVEAFGEAVSVAVASVVAVAWGVAAGGFVAEGAVGLPQPIKLASPMSVLNRVVVTKG